jgi:nucleoid-associated protein YgaU
MILIAAAVGGCVPETVGSGSPAGERPLVASPTPSPLPSGPSPSPSFVRPTPTPMPTFMAYVVRRGDSLNKIAHRFATTGRSIAFWNRATYPSLDPESSRYAPNTIQVGWTLVLIPGVVFDENSLPEPTDTPVPSASL